MEGLSLVFFHVLVPIAVALTALFVIVFGAIFAWMAWWLVRIKDHPNAILADCRNPDCDNNACIIVLYERQLKDKGVGQLRLHGSTMDVVKSWRHALRVGIVVPAHEEVAA